MKVYKITVYYRENFPDSLGQSILKDIEDLGIEKVETVRVNQIYYLKTELNLEGVNRIAQELLIDPIINKYEIFLFERSKIKLNPLNSVLIEVSYNPGVMDPWEESIVRGIRDLGYRGEIKVKTARQYLIKGQLSPEEIARIKDKLLINKVIQQEVKENFHPFPQSPEYKFELKRISILEMQDEELMKLSKKGQLFLNLEEMCTIKRYFKKLGRNPTDCELETLAQTWSEHCKHKTLRGKIEYAESGVTKYQKLKKRKFDNLLQETIMKVTEELDKPWCISVFKDNSGVIEFDKGHNICFKVETHNHPSAIEPYGGANTGIGGVIRDPLGTGLGSKPIFNTDIFCFAPPDYRAEKIPTGVLHPRRIMKGVVAGVRDYGNKMGIPTINGAVCFHPDYLGNPLVYCGNVGIMPRQYSFKKVTPGDLIVLIGGRTGRDGVHGATFSSAKLTETSEEISTQSVQIGNPITEKKITDALLKARDEKLYSAITDCGAGGLSSAVGEMGEETGAKVDLEEVPLKYQGLSYTEIWISEAQERMVLAVPPQNMERLSAICKAEEVEAKVIGEFGNDKKLKLYYEGNLVCDIDMEFLHQGLPPVIKEAVWIKKSNPEPEVEEKKNYNDDLLNLLASYNIASKEWIIRQYDHEVQGGSVIKPLVGIYNDGPSDAAVLRPILDSKKGVAVANGINPLYGLIDPYWMAASCIDEAIRQLVAVGSNPDRIALLDNFCWGDTEKKEVLGSLVRAAMACYDIAKAYQTPFISGKDSLNNEFYSGDKTISVPPTLLISSISVIDAVEKCITMDFKKEGNLIYLIGQTFRELGGSQYYYWLKESLGNDVPQVRVESAKRTFKAVYQAIQKRYIISCHDLSEGGLATAISEMCFAGGFGADIFLNEVPGQKELKDFEVLFSESNSRFLIEVVPDYKEHLENALSRDKIPFGLIGCISTRRGLNIYGKEGTKVITLDIADLKKAWQKPFV